MIEFGWRMMGVIAATLMGTTLIEVPSWGDVSLIEALWTTAGLAMIAASAWALPATIGDYVVSKRVPGHYSAARILIARGLVRREVLRLSQGVIVTVIGVYAILASPVRPGPVVVTPLGLVLTAGLILLATLTAVQTILDRRQRDQADQLMSDADAAERKTDR